ncbi:MAG: hypothetical protein ABR974_00430 [Bacteroidales bacterium]|jgi:hypothetical protein
MKTKKTGVDPIYDATFLRLKNDSVFLSSAQQQVGIGTMFWDENNLRAERFKYVGDELGYYVENGQKRIALIPDCKNRLAHIEAEFDIYCEQQMNAGFDEPEEMLPDMKERKSIIEGTLDVLEEERTRIDKMLESFDKQKQAISDSMVLNWGLMCSGRLENSILVELDGQVIGRTGDGTLIISDERSPYNGMSVSDYRKLAKIWKDDLYEKDQKQLERMRDEARMRGIPLPTQFTFYGSAIPKDQLPPFPETFKNYHKKGTLIRRK